MNKEILLLFFLTICLGMGYSIIAPLFPTIGSEMKINEALLGWIISVYGLLNFIATPFAPLLVNQIGRKQLFYISSIFVASCTLCYGFLQWITNFYMFILIAMILRMFHGIGAGISATLVYSLTSSISDPNEVKTNIGYVEVAWSIGLAIGPLIASFFYHLGGFPLPFFVSGLSFFIGIYLIYYLGIQISNTKEETLNFLKVLFYLDVIMQVIAIVVFVISNTFYFPSLTNHLTNNWGFSVEIASMFFIITMITYFIGLQFLNKMTNILGNLLTIFIGMIFIIIGALFIYPVSFLPKIVFLIIIGLGLIGASGALVNVPCLMEMGKAIKAKNLQMSEGSVNDVSAALYNFAGNVGEFLGPIFGGFISKRKGFECSCIAMSLLGVIYSGIFGVIYFKRMINDYIKGGVKEEDDSLSQNLMEGKGENNKKKEIEMF